MEKDNMLCEQLSSEIASMIDAIREELLFCDSGPLGEWDYDWSKRREAMFKAWSALSDLASVIDSQVARNETIEQARWDAMANEAW